MYITLNTKIFYLILTIHALISREDTKNKILQYSIPLISMGIEKDVAVSLNFNYGGQMTDIRRYLK